MRFGLTRSGGLPHAPAMKRLMLAVLPMVAGCVTDAPPPPLIPGDPSAPSQITPAESMAIAQRLATHPWRPFSHNILHQKDRAGVIVNTPDVGYQQPNNRGGWWIPGELNTGIPYKWGGFDSPSSFDDAIAKGLAAGDVSTPEKRRADNAAVSTQAAGVDCSGFVSRCLNLPTVHDTTHLPAICTPVADPRDLRPGDILNFPHRHVILCAGWSKPDHSWIYYFETGGGPNYWKPGLKQAPLASLLALGYQPLHYRGMAREALPAGTGPKDVLTRGVKDSAVTVPNPTVGEP